MNTLTLEADTRILIDKSLENLGWVLNGRKKNVFFEQPKTERERKLLGGERPDYVLYSKDEHGDDMAIMVIEAKRKGARVNTALEQGIRYAKKLDAPIVFATDGLFCKSYHTKFDRTPILNGEEVDEFLRETLAIKYLASWEVNTVSPKVQYDRKELIKIFDEANNMLRGDGLRAGIERFGEFANILFLKLISENEQIKRESGKISGFDLACHWDSIKNIPASARVDYINNTVYNRLNDLYKTIIFTPLTIRSDVILKEIMDKLDPLTLTDVDSDVKGDAFEYFLKESAATKNDLGEYFTPRHIVKTMVKLINPQIGEKIYDPFCGTGGFLIESFRHIWNTMARTDDNDSRLREQTIFGNEITNTARITKMNMILAGDGHSNVHMQDSLASPIDGTEEYDEVQPDGTIIRKHKGYDIVITNMPYSQKTKYGNLYDLPSNNGDSICVQHCMKAIKSTAENGRMALVVPEGFLFRKDLSKTRELLIKSCDLQSVISLPQGVFLPYTGVKTNIIYATKVNRKFRSSQKRKDFWYFDVKSDGYTLDNHRRKLDNGSDLDKYQEYRKLDDDQSQNMLDVGFEIIPFNKVMDNSCILVGSRYRETQKEIYKHESYKLTEISTFIRGVTFPKSAQRVEKTFDSIGVVTTKAAQSIGILDDDIIFVDKTYAKEGKYLQEGDILISLANSLNLVGRTTYVDRQHEGLSFGTFMGLIRVDKIKILPRMLYYLLNSEVAKKYFITNAKTTTNISNLTFEDLSDLVLPVPSLVAQQQIVDELDGYDRIIIGARTIIGNYSPFIPKSINGERISLKDIAIFKPSKDEIKHLANDTRVSFVPMAVLNTRDISFEAKETRIIEEVLTGFTYFRDNDVLLAKITPCFENGKAGIARNLINGIGFGSTEFVVIRAKTDIVFPEWIFYYINSQEFIDQGKHFMAGTAGQQRIDINFVKNYSIVVPSINEQRSILDNIETEQTLISSSKQIIALFSKKINDKINEIWSE